MNGILGNAKFNSLRIPLDPGASSLIILGKHVKKFQNIKTKHIRLSKKGGDFNTNYTSKVEIILTDLYMTKSVMWNFHMDNSQGTHKYVMILG